MGVLDAPPIDWRGKPVALFDPPRDVPNLLAWFRGDDVPGTNGATISRWASKFGGFDLNRFPGTKPTLLAAVQNGRNAVRFAPGAYLLNTDTFGAGSLGLTAGYTLPLMHAFVFRVTTDWAQTGNVLLFQQGTTQVLIALAGTNFFLNAGSNGGINGPAINDGNWHVAVCCLGAAGGAIYVDGALASVTGSLGAGTATNYAIGTGLGSVPTAGNFDLGEVVTAQLAPTPQRVDLITQALATGWGIS